MAGVLPGVECARRRRSGWRPDNPAVAVPGGSRRSSICLYPTKVDSNLYSIFSLRSSVYKAYEDDKLGEVAREARERLDKRLRAQRNSDPKRQNKNVSGGKCWRGSNSESKSLS